MFCQPLQMRLDMVAGLNMDSANRWQWRPDYEGVDLSECRCRSWEEQASLYTIICADDILSILG